MCMRSHRQSSCRPGTPPGGWLARKAAVVTAVTSGAITIEDACHRYRMLEEEFFTWQCAFENFGIVGLRAVYL